jgi:hypothetical protein
MTARLLFHTWLWASFVLACHTASTGRVPWGSIELMVISVMGLSALNGLDYLDGRKQR